MDEIAKSIIRLVTVTLHEIQKVLKITMVLPGELKEASGYDGMSHRQARLCYGNREKK